MEENFEKKPGHQHRKLLMMQRAYKGKTGGGDTN